MPQRDRTGDVVDHPAVLEIIAEDLVPTSPQPHVRQGRRIMLTRKTRLWFQRDWVDCLPWDGIFLQRIQPAGGSVTWIAMTRRELEATFANVVSRDDWGTVPYHYPKIPVRKAAAFLVPGRATTEHPPPDAQFPQAESADPMPDRIGAGRPPPADSELLEFNERWSHRAGVEPESAEYLARLVWWRSAFRPHSVRVLLVGESHVREADGDIDVHVASPVVRPAMEGAHFCRLIYCLGYGADSICTTRPRSMNTGTPWWSLFGRLAWKSMDPPLMPKQREAVALKVAVLSHLQANGVWLVDASALGVSRPGDTRAFSGDVYSSMIRESWRSLVRPSIAAEPLEQVLVIGHMTRRALGADLGLGVPEHTIAQPRWGQWKRHKRELADVLTHLPWDAPDFPENRASARD